MARSITQWMGVMLILKVLITRMLARAQAPKFQSGWQSLQTFISSGGPEGRWNKRAKSKCIRCDGQHVRGKHTQDKTCRKKQQKGAGQLRRTTKPEILCFSHWPLMLQSAVCHTTFNWGRSFLFQIIWFICCKWWLGRSQLSKDSDDCLSRITRHKQH